MARWFNALTGASIAGPTNNPDIYVGSSSVDNIDASGGNDQIYGRGGRDNLRGGSGDDLILDGPDQFDGPVARIGGGFATIDGGAGNDTAVVIYTGTQAVMLAAPTPGFLLIPASPATITIGGVRTGQISNVESLVFISGSGNDTLNGGGAVDDFDGGAGDDSISTGGGNDFLTGGAGNDILDGGLGVDTAVYETALAGVTVSLASSGASQNTFGAGIDILRNIEVIFGSNFDDRLAGDRGNNTLVGGFGSDDLFGSSGDDFLDAGGGNDTLDGSVGNDILSAGIGNDTLNGGSGNDFLVGDLGRDNMSGGSGADRFAFLEVADSPFDAPDLINDFSGRSGDRIDLTAIDGNAVAPGKQAVTFSQISFFPQLFTTLVLIDVDGVAGASANDMLIEVGAFRFSPSDFLF